jgi:hypothetical protein
MGEALKGLFAGLAANAAVAVVAAVWFDPSTSDWLLTLGE